RTFAAAGRIAYTIASVISSSVAPHSRACFKCRRAPPSWPIAIHAAKKTNCAVFGSSEPCLYFMLKNSFSVVISSPFFDPQNRQKQNQEGRFQPRRRQIPIFSAHCVLCGKILFLFAAALGRRAKYAFTMNAKNFYFLNASGSNGWPLSLYSLFTAVGLRMV